MKGIITWNVFARWFFNRTLSIYVTGFPYENITLHYICTGYHCLLYQERGRLGRVVLSSALQFIVVLSYWPCRLEVCVPECHFPRTGYFPKKSGKFPVPSIWEHPIPGPDSVPAFGTGCFPVSFKVGKHSGIPKCFNVWWFNRTLSIYI